MTEETPFYPQSPYAVAKLYGYWMTKVMREAYGIFATNGILFNHESPIRGLEFVTRKISNSAAKIALNLQKEIKLGNIHSKRDWGYAPEYVESMWKMLQHKEPGDFIVATNKVHSVLEFIEIAFDTLGLDYQEYLKIDDRFKRPLDVNYLQGDYSKTEKELKWKPKTSFKELVKLMVKADYDRWKRWIDGERFPWDAPNFRNDYSFIKRKIG